MQIEFCNKIRHEGWSVRDTERAVGERIHKDDGPHIARFDSKSRRSRSNQIENIEKRLKLALGTKVRVKQNSGGKGSIQIDFKNPEEFERLQQWLVQGAEIRQTG